MLHPFHWTKRLLARLNPFSDGPREKTRRRIKRIRLLKDEIRTKGCESPIEIGAELKCVTDMERLSGPDDELNLSVWRPFTVGEVYAIEDFGRIDGETFVLVEDDSGTQKGHPAEMFGAVDLDDKHVEASGKLFVETGNPTITFGRKP